MRNMIDKFIENWEIFLLLLIIFPIALLNILPLEMSPIKISTETLLSLILIALIAIATAQLKADPRTIHEQFEKHEYKLNELLTQTTGHISAVKPDTCPHIWEGFNGNFLAINAPWAIESDSHISYDKLVDIHIARYQNPEFNQATYIFFSSGEEGKYFPDALDRFKKFSRRMLEKNLSIANKIRVCIIDSPAPAFTIFSGYKISAESADNMKYSYAIIYINEKPLVSKQGIPRWAFVSTDSKLNSSLDDYIKDISTDYELVSLKELLNPTT